MKTLLMLGAGAMQGVAIRAAQKLGCYVVATDGNANAVCANWADEFAHIDLKDIDGLIALAKKIQAGRGLDAVFTAATDFSLAVSMIADACGLPAHSVTASQNATNKSLMRKCFQDYGVRSPKFVGFNKESLRSAEKIFAENNLQFPVVVKPVDNMGARGCAKVVNFEQLYCAIETAIQFSRSGYAIVEDFIDGKEFSLEGLVFNGQFFITAVADRHIYFPPYFVEMGHTIPANISEGEAQELIDVFIAGAKALGLTYGAIKGDIFLKDGRAYVGEIAARLSGGYMSGWTVPYSSGIDITTSAVKLALGEIPSEVLSYAVQAPLANNTKLFCAERAWISIPGVISKVEGLETAKNLVGVKDVFPRLNEGATAVFPTNNVEKAGNVLAVGATYEEAVANAENACKNILLRLKPNNKATDEYLSCESQCDSFPPNFIQFTDSTGESATEAESIKKNVFNSSKNCRYIHVEESGFLFPECFNTMSEQYSMSDLQGRNLNELLQILYKYETNLQDWLLNIIKTNDVDLWSKFWLAFIRGGVQGALYVYDCLTAE